MDIKMDLAGEVVATFHGKEAAGRAAEHFRRIFRERLVPQEMRQFRVVRATETTFFLSEKRGEVEELKPPFAVPGGKTEKWSKILLLLGQVSSSAEAERLIKQKALEINGEVMSEPTARIDFTKKAKYEVRVGKKKFVRVIIE
jgi:tyrosyl-tRNA synthetase